MDLVQGHRVSGLVADIDGMPLRVLGILGRDLVRNLHLLLRPCGGRAAEHQRSDAEESSTSELHVLHYVLPEACGRTIPEGIAYRDEDPTSPIEGERRPEDSTA